ncbi:MAG: alkyldihydroxyacetonephosphate synthase [Halieaceae bacterium]|jgi:alkyldihydroxyacetonephosphate synthase
MRHWNGWGIVNSEYTTEFGEGAFAMMEALIGPAAPLPCADLDQVIAKVPKTRLPEHPLVDLGCESRLRHARGQSLPDVMSMQGGEVDTFPDGVALPTSNHEVRELLQYAEKNGASVIPYGGGTSVAGHINPEAGEKPVLTIDMSNMNQLIELDRESNIATFGAGTPGPLVEEQLQREGYTLGHFPQSWELSTVGGWVASRSSGQQSLHYGRIEQLFAGGWMETPVGALEMPTIPASAAGPDVREMILGSEGRMGVITEVNLRVSPLPEQESFNVVFFPSWDAGLSAARKLAQGKVQLSMVRLSNEMETISLLQIGDASALADLESHLADQGVGAGMVMMTFGVTGSIGQCRSAMEITQEICSGFEGVAGGREFGEKWAHGRFRAPYLRDPLLRAGYAVDTMETAVDWVRVTDTMNTMEDAIRAAGTDLGEQVHVYTHLSHVYNQGSSIYTTYVFRCADSYADTLDRWSKLKSAGAEAIVDCGGTISHQHGVGSDHRAYITAEKGPLGIAAIRSLCQLFDPDMQMNPGKLLPDVE